MPDLIRIRSVVPLDREDILVGRRSARAALARGSEGVPPELWRASPIHELEAMLWSGRYAVAVVGGRAVAGAGWEPLADGTVLVRDLFVRPEHAGRGLARRLLGHIGRTVAALDCRFAGVPIAARNAEPALAA
jgi:GNAT superfamily N-acetyltransferase